MCRRVGTKYARCMDGSCRATKEECPSITFEAASFKNKFRCPDGRVTASASLCGTQRTCPVGYIKCWNSVCAKSLKECHYHYLGDTDYTFEPETNCVMDSSNKEFFCNGECKLENSADCYAQLVCPGNERMCSDGSCRAKFEDCPTETTCPIEKPVKCFDGTCTTSIESCPEMVDCPKYTRRCPNGQCVSIESPCGTDITCLESAPVRCYDNTCRKTFDECPPLPSCPSDRPHLCGDGSCQPSIDHCYLESQCGRSKVKCPDLRCVDDVAECSEIQGCPPGRYLCPDKSCRTSYSLCMNDTCPTSRPHKCIDGMCVQDETECNSEATGCPYETPHKCSDGLCVKNINQCERDFGEIAILCPDGAEAEDIDSCYSVYGCPSQYPFMCHDGSCIDLKTSSCPVSRCSVQFPYRCPDGLCVTDRSKCITFPAGSKCEQGTTECGNGMCVRRKELCRPLLPCWQGYIRCADGSCRPHEVLCPITDKHKCDRNGVSIRCPNGLCVDDKERCKSVESSSGCTETKCEGKNPNFEVEHYGKCVSNEADCEVTGAAYLSNGCPANQALKEYDQSCKLERTTGEYLMCDPNKIATSPTSPFGCLTLDAIATKDEYRNAFIIGARKVEAPYVCANGTFADISFMPFVGEGNTGVSYCEPQVICPTTTPYLCYDQSCESDPGHCPAVEREAAGDRENCPAARPILCSSGVCVAKVQECMRPEPMCGPSKPLVCANGVCAQSYADCIPNVFRQDPSVMCPGSAPGRELTYVCPDGSCAYSSYYCLSIIGGCSDPTAPVKTSEGGCGSAVNADSTTEKTCTSTDHKLCEDGICRRKCPDYNGCPISK